MLELVGRLVKELRIDAGLELHDLAERAGVPPEELSAFEEQGRAVSTAALDRMAYALAVEPIALAESRIVRRPDARLFFRQFSLPDLRDHQDRLTAAAALERVLALVEINEILGRSSGLHAGFSFEAPGSEPDKDAYRLAWKVRDALGNEVHTLADVVELLQRRVLDALDRELITRMKARELLGLTAWDDLPSAPVGAGGPHWTMRADGG